MKILLIEDDQQLAKSIKQQLVKVNFAVDLALNFEKAKIQINEFINEYDCLILDINLPDGSGFDLCKEVRQKQLNTIPILVLTARDAIRDKVKGLDLGVDDYLAKPIDSRELIARIRALIRRNKGTPFSILKIGDLEINPQTQRVKRAGKKIKLVAKEFSVLEFLAFHSDEVVTRAMIMEHIWSSDFEFFSNVIDVYIKNLRKKIDLPGKKKLIHTIRGSGYSLSEKR